MRNELFEYAINTLIYKKSKKPNHSIFFSNIAVAICMYFVMAVISIPLIMSKPYVCMILLALWLLILILRRKERNEYMKAILIDAMFLIYLAIFLSYILIRFFNAEIKTILIIVTVVYLLAYEITFIIKVFQKRYSSMKQNDLSRDNKLITTLSFMGAFLGIILYKIFPKSNPYFIYQIMFVAIVGAFWLSGFILIQKYNILKLQKYK